MLYFLLQSLIILLLAHRHGTLLDVAFGFDVLFFVFLGLFLVLEILHCWLHIHIFLAIYLLVLIILVKVFSVGSFVEDTMIAILPLFLLLSFLIS